MTTNLDSIPDPPPHLCEFDPADWPEPPPSSDHIPMNAQLYRREQQRIARVQWGATHGLTDWQDIVDMMARGRARLYSERARTLAGGSRETRQPEPAAALVLEPPEPDQPPPPKRVDAQSFAAEHARAHLGGTPSPTKLGHL